MYDILIRNGIVIDGTGTTAMMPNDIGIKDGKIRDIGYLEGEKADQVIDASGCYVSPGFVDAHNHSDTFWRVFTDPDLESLIRQGITTAIGGNCGLSLAPLGSKDIFKTVMRWSEARGININWLKMKEYLDVIEKRSLSVNFGSLVGYDTLRQTVVAEPLRRPTESEKSMMNKILAEALKDGALGFSVGLNYHTHHQTDTEEIVELAQTIKKNGGIVTVHLRNESAGIVKSVVEAIDIAQQAQVPVQISHFQLNSDEQGQFTKESFDLIATARERGTDIAFDVVPYTTTTMALYSVLPHWAIAEGIPMLLLRLKDRKTREHIGQELKEQRAFLGNLMLSVSPLNRSILRRRLGDIAVSQEKPVEEVVFDLLVASSGQAIVMSGGMAEKTLQQLLQNPHSMISSNGAGYDLEYRKTGNLLHPRNFGAFPRVLGNYVRNIKLMPWETAVYKMTGKPAGRFGLVNRGTLREGNFADIVVFDSRTIEDVATYDNPYQYPKGIKWVLVNGKVALSEGNFTGERSGRVIRKGKK